MSVGTLTAALPDAIAAGCVQCEYWGIGVSGVSRVSGYHEREETIAEQETKEVVSEGLI
jgi:hypothetical protein